MKKIACFFTCGYTERVEMLGFLRRLRPDVEYDQRCPTRRPRSRRPGMTPKENGLTGQGLLDYVYNHLSAYQAELQDYDAVLIEDDLDEKFSYEKIQGQPKTRIRARTPEFFRHCDRIRTDVRRQLNKKPDFPVILLYASPEIELWFLTDWSNTFGRVYGSEVMDILTTQENQFFSARFKPYVAQNVMVSPYCLESRNIEHYGYFDGKYKKLSEELIQALNDFKIRLYAEPDSDGAALGQTVGGNPRLIYSKALQGPEMLKCLNPDTVYLNCPHYFQWAVDELRRL